MHARSHTHTHTHTHSFTHTPRALSRFAPSIVVALDGRMVKPPSLIAISVERKDVPHPARSTRFTQLPGVTGGWGRLQRMSPLIPVTRPSFAVPSDRITVQCVPVPNSLNGRCGSKKTKNFELELPVKELRNCVKVVFGRLWLLVSNSPCDHCGRKATLNSNCLQHSNTASGAV